VSSTPLHQSLLSTLKFICGKFISKVLHSRVAQSMFQSVQIKVRALLCGSMWLTRCPSMQMETTVISSPEAIAQIFRENLCEYDTGLQG
jgi:hypothetical protein